MVILLGATECLGMKYMLKRREGASPGRNLIIVGIYLLFGVEPNSKKLKPPKHHHAAHINYAI